jgi:ParB family chromosome partitioning protein
MKEKARLQALLPVGWEKDFTTFFALDGNLLMSLMAFCTACSVDGVQTRDMGHTARSPLDTLETALGFHLRDWWHPTKENYFSGLKQPQIVASLKEAGLTGAAGDAEKMKKAEAAEHAAFFMKENRWVPAWLKGPAPVVEAPADESTTDTETSTDNGTTANAA